MKVKRIDLDDEEMPETVTVELTREEAAYVTLLIGKQAGADMDAVMPGGTAAASSLYEGLASLFNRFYEDGVDDPSASRAQ